MGKFVLAKWVKSFVEIVFSLSHILNQFWIKSRQKEQCLRTKHKDKQHSKPRKACSKINSLQFEENIFEQIYQSSLILLIFIKEKMLINITNLNNIREQKVNQHINIPLRGCSMRLNTFSLWKKTQHIQMRKNWKDLKTLNTKLEINYE